MTMAEENCGAMVRSAVRFRAPIVLLEAEVMECDGRFRRVVSVRQPDGRVQNLADWLEVGNTYRANVRWTDSELSLLTPVRGPMHHAVGVHFVNPEVVPRDFRTRTIHFEVLSVRIDQMREWEWLSLYELKIVRTR
jgi:hypothetical protein